MIAELDSNVAPDHRYAKFTVLAESVRHHIKEEENEMLPKAQKAKVDFEALTAKMARRKERLLAEGVAPVAEDAMVKASRGRGDSPARASKRKAPKLPKGKKG